MNPAELLYRAAALKPKNPALLRGTDLVANYAEFSRRTAAMYGIWWSGAAAPISAKLHEKESAWIIENAGACPVVASGGNFRGFGVKKPDCVSEVTVAEVSVVGRPVDATVLDSLCIDNIARFKRPKHYVELTELPETITAKWQKPNCTTTCVNWISERQELP